MEAIAKTLGFRRRQYRRLRSIVIWILFAYGIDIIWHYSSLHISSPSTPLDPPFATSCQVRGQDGNFNTQDATTLDNTPSQHERENAAIMILARNQDLDGVMSSILSLERQWNHRYNYPYVLLNDKAWDSSFISSIRNITTSELIFDTIPQEMWSWPRDPSTGKDVVNRAHAQKSWARMKKAGLPYSDLESYHHMCRFFSGFFYDHPAMAKYRYYWRVEPDVEFTCRIPYDPFLHMRLRDKIYGYTLALWEVGATCPSLFRTTAEFKDENGIATSSLWNSLLSSNWAPLPVRWFIMSLTSFFDNRTPHGDSWNHCHLWSNFEIADMDFFRSWQYRSYFKALDAKGGFYMERWGDAPVHSLALALFARPEQLHWFEDVGYRHDPFQHCPRESVGCECECRRDVGAVDGYCMDRFRKGVDVV